MMTMYNHADENLSKHIKVSKILVHSLSYSGKTFELYWKKCTDLRINLTSQDIILGGSGKTNDLLNY